MGVGMTVLYTLLHLHTFSNLFPFGRTRDALFVQYPVCGYALSSKGLLQYRAVGLFTPHTLSKCV